jgi:hypothetical protein
MSLYSQSVTDNALCVWNLESSTPTIDSFKGSIGTVTRTTTGSPSFVSGGPTGSGYINFTNNSGFRFTQADATSSATVNDRQVEAVFRTSHTGTTQYIYSRRAFINLNISQNNDYKLSLSYPDNNQTRTVLSNSAVNDGNWHHVVAGYINGELAMYLDGQKQTNTASRTNTTAALIYKDHGVGEQYTSTTNPDSL